MGYAQVHSQQPSSAQHGIESQELTTADYPITLLVHAQKWNLTYCKDQCMKQQ